MRSHSHSQISVGVAVSQVVWVKSGILLERESNNTLDQLFLLYIAYSFTTESMHDIANMSMVTNAILTITK